MKLAIWIIFGLLAAVWTGGALLTAGLVRWVADVLASGQTAELARSAAQWPLPAWLPAWVDPAWMGAAQQALSWTIEAVGGSLPMFGAAIGWMLPVVWAVWGLGVAIMLALAGGAHVVLGRVRGRRGDHAAQAPAPT
jgi:hypothetical protein